MNILRRLKRKLIGRNAVPKLEKAPAQAIEHPVLGSLTPDTTDVGALVGRVPYCGKLIEIQVYPDDKSMEAALSLMVAAVSCLASLDEKCRHLIAQDSLEGYNSDWRFGQQKQSDGSFEKFEKPLLSEEEFSRKLQFQSVVATGDSLLTFWYGDSDMFWGHSLYLDSFDGVTFEDTHVSMFG